MHMTLKELNVAEQCRQYRVPLLSCPHFLFLVMGFVIIIAIIATNIAAQRYTDPEAAALIVLIVTVILLVISHVIVQSFERIADAARARAEFVSIASHQLRSPLTSIKWQLELFMQDQSLGEKTRSQLVTLNDHNNRMIKIVNDLLEVNRIESERLTLRPSPFSLYTLVKKSVDAYSLPAQGSHITLTLRADPDVPLVYADEMRVRWVVENLIDNGVRYSDPNTTIVIAVEREGSFVRLDVTNTGMEIPPQEQKRIFQKFFRGEGPLKMRPEGSGLGLFVAKSIAEASGGNIGFTSKNRQTTFWFTLPVATASQLIPTTTSQTAPQAEQLVSLR